MNIFPIDMDRDIQAVYCSEVRRPGYVLQGPMHGRSVLAPVAPVAAPATSPRPLTVTLRERELHRHGALENRRPGH